MSSTGPQAYIIAGPNGAGKTTFATRFLPHFVDCREFLNADLIAAGLAPFQPEKAAVRAGRLLLERMQELVRQRQDFGFETTLAGRHYLKVFQEMRQAGYRLHLFFLWLPNVEMALSRVSQRVRQGGHHIPEEIVRRRYSAGLKNLFQSYRPIVNSLYVFNGAILPPQPIAFATEQGLEVQDAEKYETIMEFLGRARHE